MNGNFTSGTDASIVNINDNGQLTVTGDVTVQNNRPLNINYGGTLLVNGSTSLYSKLQVNRGSSTIVDGNVTVYNEENLVVAESSNTNSTYYADLVVKQNLFHESSGDIVVNSNGRVAIYGDITGSSNGGTLFTVNAAGSVYVHGDVTFTGGGDQINNNNSTSSFGFYVNGTIANTGSGSNTTSNVGDQGDLASSDPDFASWVSSQPGSPVVSTLPVELFSFTASSQVRVINLDWTTAMEENFDFFTVERASNDLEFEAIGTIQGNGFSTAPIDYQFSDKAPLSEANYYRLKATDLDGTVEYHPIISVWFERTATARVYPNPVTDQRVYINGNVTLLKIHDLTGNTIFSQSIPSQTKTIQLPGELKAGTYIAILGYSDRSTSQQTLIIR